MKDILIKEGSLQNAYAVDSTIVEFRDRYDIDEFKKRLSKPPHIILVAYSDQGKPVGYLTAYDRDHDGSIYIWMGGVSPKYRKRGVFRELYKEFLSWTMDQGFKKIKIKTRNDKRAMLSFLVKEGFNFVLVEEKPNMLDNRIHLEKELLY